MDNTDKGMDKGMDKEWDNMVAITINIQVPVASIQVMVVVVPIIVLVIRIIIHPQEVVLMVDIFGILDKNKISINILFFFRHCSLYLSI
jgi:hypothetical protein